MKKKLLKKKKTENIVVKQSETIAEKPVKESKQKKTKITIKTF